MKTHTLAAALVTRCTSLGITISTAESCTGGLIGAAITEIPGSSAVLDRGFITYSNAAKTALLGVPAEIIASHGAVSAQVAALMAQGAINQAGTTLCVSVTGIAGPGGGSAEKPVGTVWFGLACQGGAPQTHHQLFPGTRAEIRAASVAFALTLLLQATSTP